MGDNTEIPTDSFLDRVLELGQEQPAVADGSIGAGGNRVEAGEVLCSMCGSECGAGWAFCETCGEVLTAGLSVPGLTAQPAAPAAPPQGPIEGAGSSDGPEGGEPPAVAPSELDSGDDDEEQSRHAADQTAALMVPVTAVSNGALSVRSSPAEIAPRSRRTLLVRSAIGIVMACLVAAAITGWVQYNHTQDRLRETRHQLSDTQASLDFTKDQLSATRGELTTTRGTLKTTQDELGSTKEELAKSLGSLNNAQDRLDLQAGQIDTLQTCLHGVSEALTDVAYGAYDAAVSALSAVEGSCREASSIL